MEKWKDIKGYEGIYQVSDLGRVRSLCRVVMSKRIGTKTVSSRILKQSNALRYNTVSLAKYGQKKTRSVHQLVAESFLDYKPNKSIICVDHKNNKPRDNKLSNLQIISHRKNLAKDNKSRVSMFHGVHRQSNKWRSRIEVNKKSISLGMFDCHLRAAMAVNTYLAQNNIA